jgi:hypothetical protein
MVHNQGEQAKLIKGVPGEAQQKVFYEATRAWAEAEKFPVFFFEAFDENWKGGIHPNEVEKHWGLFRADRSEKLAVDSGTEQSFADPARTFFTVAEADIRDRIRGAWVGQMIGVTWGFPTEFYARYIHQLFPDFHQRDGEPFNIYAAYEGGMIPYDELPEWDPAMINGGFTQDDLYVEIPFLEALDEHGVNCGWQAYGDAFRDTRFPLYHANGTARENLQAGLPAPASGHYANNGHADDIDWQIEADFVGLINPGQPHSAAEIAWRAGHVMNYGDGVYGGVFVATMIATAFTAENLDEIIEAGRQSVPMGSTYRAVIEQLLADHAAGVSREQASRNLIDTWGTVDRCVDWAGASDPLNIDARLNGAFILLGLLYGDGDFAETMRIAMAAGQDSDCNPSNAGSVLGAYYGFEKIAAMETDWVSALDDSLVFQTTDYTLEQLVDLSLTLARRVVVFKGGTVEEGGAWRIPQTDVAVTPILEQWPLKENEVPELQARAEVIEGTVVRFEAEAEDQDGIRSFQWYFGDLTYADGASGTHTYPAPGTYTATCFVSDGVANTAWRQVDVVIE